MCGKHEGACFWSVREGVKVQVNVEYDLEGMLHREGTVAARLLHCVSWVPVLHSAARVF